MISKYAFLTIIVTIAIFYSLPPCTATARLIGDDAVQASIRRVYEPTWDSLGQHGAAPKWYRDAVFGIYFHWGIYSIPAY